MVSIDCVKSMSPIPRNIRPHGDSATAHATRPLLGCVDQHLSDSAGTDVLVHNEAVYFHIAVRFNAPEKISSDPAGELASRNFRDKKCILVRILHLAQSLVNLLPGTGVTELYCKASHSVAIARLSSSTQAPRRAQCHDIRIFVHSKTPSRQWRPVHRNGCPRLLQNENRGSPSRICNSRRGLSPLRHSPA